MKRSIPAAAILAALCMVGFSGQAHAGGVGIPYSHTGKHHSLRVNHGYYGGAPYGYNGSSYGASYCSPFRPSGSSYARYYGSAYPSYSGTYVYMGGPVGYTGYPFNRGYDSWYNYYTYPSLPNYYYHPYYTSEPRVTLAPSYPVSASGERYTWYTQYDAAAEARRRAQWQEAVARAAAPTPPAAPVAGGALPAGGAVPAAGGAVQQIGALPPAGALPSAPDLEQTSINQGDDLFERRDYAKAESAFLKATIINPRSRFAFFALANAQLAQGKHSEAAASLLKGLANHPAWFGEEVKLRNFFATREDYDQAVRKLEAEVTAAGDRNDLRFLLAYVHYFSGGYDKALEALKPIPEDASEAGAAAALRSAIADIQTGQGPPRVERWSERK